MFNQSFNQYVLNKEADLTRPQVNL